MDYASQSIEQLIVRSRSGDEAAFAELLRRLGPEVRLAIIRRVPAGNHQADTNEYWARMLNQTWQHFGQFAGTSTQDLSDWLRQTVLHEMSTSSTGSQETIPPVPKRDQPTIVAAKSNSLAAKSPDASQAEVPVAEDPPPDPSAVTKRDGNLGTVASPPPETPSDPLETIPPTNDKTLGGDPLATVTEGLPVQLPSPRETKTFGHFEILETIAKGGMGVVHKAKDQKLDRIVALKMILAGQFANPEDIERFYDEARAAAHLNHMNIVGIYEVGQYEDQHFISMQFIEGQSLADLVREHPLHPRTACKYMQAISEAMQYAHDQGILHRDLKPSNILVDDDNVPLVTDFGLAKLNPNDSFGDEATRVSQTQRTMDGVPMGTPSFMPPEQAIGKLDEISARSDVYSLGATLYNLLTGKPPFGAANVMETLRQVREVEPVAPRVLNANVPKDLETICLKCLQKAPAKRYATAQELADELRRYLAGEPILARPVGIVERLIRWCRRNPWPTTAIAASLCGLIVATVLWQSAVSARIEADAANATAQARRIEADEANATAQMERAEAVVARDQARASRSQLFAAINELFTTWGNVTLLNEPALADVRKELLTAATKLYTDIGKHLGDDDELKQELGVAHYRLALMMFHMEGYHEADAAAASARANLIITNLAAVDDFQRLSDWGDTLTLSGSIDVKLSFPRNNPGINPDDRLVLLVDAKTHYDNAMAVRIELNNRMPSELEFQRQLWSVQMNLGTVAQWQGDAFDQRSFLKQDDPAAAAADFEKMEEHYKLARDTFLQVQRARELALEAAPATWELKHDLAQGSYNLAYVSFLLMDYGAAKAQIETAIETFVELLESRPDDLQNQFDLARSEQSAGEIAAEWMWYSANDEQRRMLYDEAIHHYRNASDLYVGLDRKSPSIVTRYQLALGALHTRLGVLHKEMENSEAARESYETSILILEPLVAAHPEARPIQSALDDAKDGLNLLAEPPPSTPAPSTPTPSTPAPSTPTPSTPAPSTPAPSTPAPSTPAPSTETPDAESPTTEDDSTIKR